MLQVWLLGQFEIKLDGRRVTLSARAAQSLLAYLMLSAGTGHRREKLAGLFWNELPEENARRNLRKEIWRIRKTLVSPTTPNVEYLLADELTVAFNEEAEHWLDAAQLQKPDTELESLISGVSLYRGELLPGMYDDWITLEREHLQGVYEAKMQTLLEKLIGAQRWHTVIEWGGRWIAQGQTPEPAYRALMVAHGALGNLSQVALDYERCAEALRNDLGVEPSGDTRALYETLIRGGTSEARLATPLPTVLVQPSGAITFLFSDIDGSAKLREQLGNEYATLLSKQYDLMCATAEKFNGHTVDTQGDAFFFAFLRAADAVNFAAEAQRALAAHEWPHLATVRVRMGLHTGEPGLAHAGYVGMDVHRAARIGAAGHGGQVLLSQTTSALVENQLPEGTQLKDLGEHKLKDLSYPVHIVQLSIEGLPSEFPPLRAISSGSEPPAPGEPPFKGLEFFDEKDAALFFGREDLTARLVQDLRDSNFLAVVVGASGSGKSSVVRAGVVPALKKGTPLADGTIPPADSQYWVTRILTPTAHPLEALATALTRDEESVTATATLIDDLTQDPRALHLLLRRRSTDHAGPSLNTHTFLVIDQFEELFTLCRDEFEREAFVDNLLTALAYGEDGLVTVMLTIRADFYAHLAQYPDLRDAVAKHQEFIGPMTSQELRRAIEEPAKLDGWQFDPGLVDLILRDVGDEPGALPLLSHALLETWKRRSGRTLTLKGYHDAGGVRGAIAQTAESVYQQFIPQEQALAREIFLRLTELGEGTEDTRRRASFDELIPRNETAASVHTVLVRLADARLVTLHANSAEVAHEALIREWPQLREWLNQDRDGLRLHRHLTEAAQEWEMLDGDTGALYRGARLAQGQEYVSANPQRINALERAFLAASAADAERAEREREEQRARELAQAQTLAEEQARRLQEQTTSNKRLRQRAFVLAGAVVLALLAAGAAIFFLNQSNANLQAATEQRAEANQQRELAQKEKRLSTARELAATALTNLGVDAQRSVLLALQAVRATQEQDKLVLPEAENALHRAVIASRAQLTIEAGQGPLWRAVYSPDGSQIATRAHGMIQLWDAKTGKQDVQIPIAAGYSTAATGIGTADYDNVVFSSDGTQLAIVDYDSNDKSHLWAKIFDAHSGQLVRQTKISMTADEWSMSDYSSDLTKVVIGSFKNTATVWDSRTGELLQTLSGHHASVIGGAFSADGKRIVTTSVDGSAKVWDAANGQELRNLCCHIQPVDGAAFSPDGIKVATGSDDRTVKIWDATTGKELLTLSGLTDQVKNVAFSPDGKMVAGSSFDRTVLVWNSETGDQLYRLAGHSDVVQGIRFSPDGKHIVTASWDGSAVVWGAEPSHEVAAISTLPIWRSAISQDHARLATSNAESKFMVWDLARRQLLLTFTDPGAYQADILATIAISPDGKRVSYSTADAVKVWDVESGKQMLSLAPKTQDIQPSWVGIPTFSADGKRILGSFDYSQEGKTLRHVLIWNAVSGAQLADLSLPKNEGTYGAIALSPDGTRLVSGDSSGAVRMFDAQTGEMLREENNSSFVDYVLFSPDGKHYVSANLDGKALVRDTATGNVLFPALTQSSTIYQVDYSSDGKYIATAGLDGVAKVWDANTGEELHTLQGGSAQIRGAHFNSDGSHLITTGMDGVIREYTLRIDELVGLGEARLTRTWTQDECSKFLHVEQCPPSP